VHDAGVTGGLKLLVFCDFPTVYVFKNHNRCIQGLPVFRLVAMVGSVTSCTHTMYVPFTVVSVFKIEYFSRHLPKRMRSAYQFHRLFLLFMIISVNDSWTGLGFCCISLT
jgi:hypothetical protein